MATVYDREGNDIGSIKRLMIEKLQRTSGLCDHVLRWIHGLGSEEHTIPWGKLNYDTSLGGYRTDITKLDCLGKIAAKSKPALLDTRGTRPIGFGRWSPQKGAQTFVASPAGNSCVCREGKVGLATSGWGDVLAGIIAGLLARGTDCFSAACWGVYLHAVAGANLARSIGPLGFLAREISREIPRLMAELKR